MQTESSLYSLSLFVFHYVFAQFVVLQDFYSCTWISHQDDIFFITFLQKVSYLHWSLQNLSISCAGLPSSGAYTKITHVTQFLTYYNAIKKQNPALFTTKLTRKIWFVFYKQYVNYVLDLFYIMIFDTVLMHTTCVLERGDR